MKKLLLVSLLAIQVAALCLAQNQTLPQKLQHLYAPLDKGQVPSGFLWNLGTSFVEPLDYRGAVHDSNYADINLFGMAYGAMRDAHVGSGNNLPSPACYLDKIKQGSPDGVMPLALMAWCYHRLRPDAASLNLVQYHDGQLHDVAGRTQSPYWQDTLIMASPLGASIGSLEAKFCLPSDLWFNNLGGQLPSLSLDADDGLGWRTLTPGDTIQADYASEGEKTLLFRLIYPNGQLRFAHAKINVKDEGTSNRENAMKWPQGTNQTIFVVSSKSYTDPSGVTAPGAATMHIFYNQSNCNTSFRMVRPLIVVEGYEEVNVASSTFHKMFDLLNDDKWSVNSENLTDHLYPYEYNLIYVDLFDGSDYIQRNAYVVEEVIKIVNAMKAQAGSTEPNVVIGVSMGGVASMYALKDMNNNGPHDTRLFFTYDSPLRGANIPIATQSLIKFMNDNLSGFTDGLIAIPELDRVWQAIQAPTPRQLLRYHVNNIGSDGAEPINTFSVAFFAEMDALGALGCRHVALSNGAGNGTSIENNILPNTNFFNLWGEKVVCKTVSVSPLIIFCGHVEFSATLRATGNDIPTTVFQGYILRDEPLSPPVRVDGYVNCFTKAFDTAPGGSSDHGVGPLGVLRSAMLKAGVTVNGPGLTATHHCFIPTFSSVSMASVPSNITGSFTCGTANRCSVSSTSSTSRFSGLGEINQEHVAIPIDERIALVLIDELVTNSLPPAANILTGFPTLNTYFNVGQAIYAPIPSITITGNSGKLSINNIGRVAFATGTEPMSPLDKLLVDTKCEAIITVESGAQLVIGADGGVKDGVLKVGPRSRVHIKTGGTLRITSSNSQLWIKPEAALILDPGANVILDDPESNILIEGALIWNGNINFVGNGYFHFSNTQQLILGPNADAFRLVGRGATKRFLRFSNTSIMIPNSKGVDLQDGLIENNSSKIFLGTGSWALMRHVNMYGFAGAGARGLEGQDVGSINIENCYFNGIDVPFYIDGSSNYQSNQTKIVNSEFRNYPDGSYFAKRWSVSVEGSKFISGGSAGHGLFFEDNFVNVVRNCEIEGHDHIEASGIKSEGNWLVWMDGGEVRGCETGIKNIDGKPSNIFMTHWATIRDCTYGVDMIGNATNGLVVMDCARLITNVFGIHGQDATLVVAPQVVQQSGNTPRPNVFIRKSTGGWFIEVCYKLKKSPEPLSAQFDFWGVYNNGGTTITDTEPWLHIDLRKSGGALPCAQPILVVTNPALEIEPISCRRDGFMNPPPFECNTLVNTGTVNGSSVTVSQQFHAGLNLIQSGDYNLSKTSFAPVANLWDPEQSSGSPDCNLLIQAGRSLASGQWYAPEEQSENRKDDSLDKSTDYVFPNPTDDLFYIEHKQSATFLEVWDIFGHKWFQSAATEANIEVDCSSWPSGIYLVELQGPSGRQRTKVVVQH